MCLNTVQKICTYNNFKNSYKVKLHSECNLTLQEDFKINIYEYFWNRF